MSTTHKQAETAPFPKSKKFEDLTGKTFGKLTILSFAPPYVAPSGNKAYRWNTKCACGNFKVVRQHHLTTGGTLSCGCWVKVAIGIRSATHGKSTAPEYVSWRKMKNRCADKAHAARYSERGIIVCERWKSSFLNFLEDMGPKPSPEMSIDRIDNNKGYFKENCRWATTTTQNRNTERAVTLTYEGTTKHLKEWSEETGVPYQTLYCRLRKGLNPQQVLKV